MMMVECQGGDKGKLRPNAAVAGAVNDEVGVVDRGRRVGGPTDAAARGLYAASVTTQAPRRERRRGPGATTGGTPLYFAMRRRRRHASRRRAHAGRTRNRRPTTRRGAEERRVRPSEVAGSSSAYTGRRSTTSTSSRPSARASCCAPASTSTPPAPGLRSLGPGGGGAPRHPRARTSLFGAGPRPPPVPGGRARKPWSSGSFRLSPRRARTVRRDDASDTARPRRLAGHGDARAEAAKIGSAQAKAAPCAPWRMPQLGLPQARGAAWSIAGTTAASRFDEEEEAAEGAARH